MATSKPSQAPGTRRPGRFATSGASNGSRARSSLMASGSALKSKMRRTLRAAQLAGRPLIENLKRRVEPADAVKPGSQRDLGHRHSRFDNQLFREENAARLSNSDQRGSKMLPEETPKLTLTDAEPLGQCI